MSVLTPDHEPRRVIPRRRDSQAAVITGELVPVPVRNPEETAAGADEDLAKHVSDWEQVHSIGHAADLVSAAVVADRPRAGEAAAAYLARHRSETGSLAVQLAMRVLSGAPLRTSPLLPDD